MLSNFLAAEPLIIARLKAKTSVRHVLSVADLAGVEEGGQFTPAMHVLFTGYAPTQEREDGRIQQIEQTWTVVVAVRNVRDTRTGAAARSEAGVLITETLAALAGWKPSDEFSALKLARAVPPAFTTGFAYFPLAFTARVLAEGEGNG